MRVALGGFGVLPGHAVKRTVPLAGRVRSLHASRAGKKMRLPNTNFEA